MCVFSQRVDHVSNTRIFARALDGAEQVLVYSMVVGAPEDLAMVLPLPVPAGAPDDGVRFIDLSGYRRFFDDLEAAFPAPQSHSNDDGMLSLAIPGGAPLVVHAVGDFEASFVPTRDDFDRLDARFVVPRTVWDRVPALADWGFAVFKLKGGAGKKDIHPMAFRFPRRDPASLFFPTLHVHDGKVRYTARFDHVLYLQLPRETVFPDRAWRRSMGSASRTAKAELSGGALDGDQFLFRRKLRGRRWNRDVVVPLPGSSS